MTHEDLRYDVSDQIAEISLARAPVNALSLSLLEQLIAALRRAAADENVRAVVLTSALPRRFSAGLDLRLMLGKPAAEVRRLLDKLYVELADVQYNLGKPSIAAVGGSARGGGMTLAISCYVLIAGATCSLPGKARHLAIPKSISASFRQFILCICRALSAVIAPSSCCSAAAPLAPKKPFPSASSAGSCRTSGCGTKHGQWRVFLRRSRDQPCGWDALLSCVSTISITGAALARRWRISATLPRPPTLRKECGRSSKSGRRIGSRRQMAV